MELEPVGGARNPRDRRRLRRAQRAAFRPRTRARDFRRPSARARRHPAALSQGPPRMSRRLPRAAERLRVPGSSGCRGMNHAFPPAGQRAADSVRAKLTAILKRDRSPSVHSTRTTCASTAWLPPPAHPARAAARSRAGAARAARDRAHASGDWVRARAPPSAASSARRSRHRTGRECPPARRIAEPGEALELPPPATGDRLAERLARNRRRNRNGLRGAELLAHEEERDRGRQQHAGDRRRERRRRRERSDPLAERPVADLVVGLEEIDERGRRQHAARAPAPAAAVGERSPW